MCAHKIEREDCGKRKRDQALAANGRRDWLQNPSFIVSRAKVKWIPRFSRLASSSSLKRLSAECDGFPWFWRVV